MTGQSPSNYYYNTHKHKTGIPSSREGGGTALMIIGFILAIFGTYYLWWGPDSTITLSGVVGGLGLVLLITGFLALFSARNR